ncbi:hypothetical protein [Paludisphaera mucosa]|uniref:Uncharacterized protein n=1 Tax=Paludisphaera mucosa TaxID=3030827 RepID=A0ABT6FKI7_9BACT|nr:hypothetical protein [Paludisphaera mucosa]MDG3008088.1 hypothetical protein [Paludisphaera mucosa]
MVVPSNAGRTIPAWFMMAFWFLMVAVTAWAAIKELATDDPWLAATALPVLLTWYQLRGEFFPRRSVEGPA